MATVHCGLLPLSVLAADAHVTVAYYWPGVADWRTWQRMSATPTPRSDGIPLETEKESQDWDVVSGDRRYDTLVTWHNAHFNAQEFQAVMTVVTP